MLHFIKNKLSKIYTTITTGLTGLFTQEHVDQQTYKQLEKLLLEADVGFKTTKHIMHSIEGQAKNSGKVTGIELKKILELNLNSLIKHGTINNADIILLVGINGSGKTTSAAKLAYYFKQQQKKVLLVAADTFRAAAQEQLQIWANHENIDIVLAKPNQDPSSVVFSGCERFKNEQYDMLIIDTAGRLQTKYHLMQELAKMKRVIERQLPDKKISTLLTIDAMLGQNSFEQAKLFNECTQVNGIVLTKMDGTGKGGIIFAINHELNIPIVGLSFGEKIDDFREFNPQEYVQELLN